VRYSTPPGYTGVRVWCRVVGEELSITARSNSGDLSEIWRHQLSTPGVPQIIDEHYPDHPDGRSIHQPRLQPRSEAELAFVGIGPGAGRWLKEAGPAGAVRTRAKIARAVELATVLGNDKVDQALGLAATAGRFAVGVVVREHRLSHHAPGWMSRSSGPQSSGGRRSGLALASTAWGCLWGVTECAVTSA
jgi:hypothetical protein